MKVRPVCPHSGHSPGKQNTEEQYYIKYEKFRDEFAVIENRILEKKMAEQKKEELRKKNIEVSIYNVFFLFSFFSFFFRNMVILREQRNFMLRILMRKTRMILYQMPN